MAEEVVANQQRCKEQHSSEAAREGARRRARPGAQRAQAGCSGHARGRVAGRGKRFHEGARARSSRRSVMAVYSDGDEGEEGESTLLTGGGPMAISYETGVDEVTQIDGEAAAAGGGRRPRSA